MERKQRPAKERDILISLLHRILAQMYVLPLFILTSFLYSIIITVLTTGINSFYDIFVQLKSNFIISFAERYPVIFITLLTIYIGLAVVGFYLNVLAQRQMAAEEHQRKTLSEIVEQGVLERQVIVHPLADSIITALEKRVAALESHQQPDPIVIHSSKSVPPQELIEKISAIEKEVTTHSESIKALQSSTGVMQNLLALQKTTKKRALLTVSAEAAQIFGTLIVIVPLVFYGIIALVHNFFTGH